MSCRLSFSEELGGAGRGTGRMQESGQPVPAARRAANAKNTAARAQDIAKPERDISQERERARKGTSSSGY